MYLSVMLYNRPKEAVIPQEYDSISFIHLETYVFDHSSFYNS